jgi:nucleoside diphosphate kinase
MPAIAITDHGTNFGAYDFYQTAKANGVKPIIGIEAYLSPGTPRTERTRVQWGVGGEDDVSGGGAFTHLTMFAETTEGMYNLFKMSSKAWLDGFYFKPRMDRELLQEYGKGIIDALVNYMASGPVIAMVIEGNQAVAIVKKLVGGTEPTTSDVGTIRGDLTLDSYQLANIDSRAVRNLIHCSDQVDEARREIELWMSSNDVYDYRTVHEAMLYDVNLDGTKE